MPEGPTILMLSEECQVFVGRKVLRVSGNSTLIDPKRMLGRKVLECRSFGKNFLLRFSGFSLRVHFMLFGSYRINERRESAPRISLGFSGDEELNLYACSVRYIEEPLEQVFDWTADVLSPTWDPDAARAKLVAKPDTLVCDALLDQTVFAGVGNIIKNESLFRIHLHPLSKIGCLPPDRLDELIEQARTYSFDFLAWKRVYLLKKNLLAHNKSTCPRCALPFKRAYLGRTHRRSFSCTNCQDYLSDVPLPVVFATKPRRTVPVKKAGTVKKLLPAKKAPALKKVPAVKKAAASRKSPTVKKAAVSRKTLAVKKAAPRITPAARLKPASSPRA